jgi:hypothetical protein
MVFRYKPGVFWAFLALTLLVISASPVSALGVPPYPGSAVINSASPAGLEVTMLNVASGQPYEVVKDGLTSGAPVYLDCRYTFTTIPADLSNSTYIKTANKDKKQAQVDFLTFSVNQAVTVYVAYDERAKSLPDWLSDWDHIGARIDTTDVGHNLFSKDFAAGSITLGGNRAAGAAGARSNYSVIVAA